jgi:hypothetical protein
MTNHSFKATGSRNMKMIPRNNDSSDSTAARLHRMDEQGILAGTKHYSPASALALRLNDLPM